MVTTTREVFLGLTMGCARCHNHKFEPLYHARLLPHGRGLRTAERPADGRTERTLPIGTRAHDRAAMRKSSAPGILSP